MFELSLMAALLAKHFVADFLLQFSRHYLNKGYYGRWGGVEHALIHASMTFIILLLFKVDLLPSTMVLYWEFMAHYHIDWAKMKLNRAWNLKPDNSEQFWWLLGLDQWLHNVCYVVIVLAVR